MAKQVSRMKRSPRELVTVGQAAEILNVVPNTMRRWAAQGFLREYRVGPREDRRFYRSDVTRLLKSNLKEWGGKEPPVERGTSEPVGGPEVVVKPHIEAETHDSSSGLDDRPEADESEREESHKSNGVLHGQVDSIQPPTVPQGGWEKTHAPLEIESALLPSDRRTISEIIIPPTVESSRVAAFLGRLQRELGADILRCWASWDKGTCIRFEAVRTGSLTDALKRLPGVTAVWEEPEIEEVTPDHDDPNKPHQRLIRRFGIDLKDPSSPVQLTLEL